MSASKSVAASEPRKSVPPLSPPGPDAKRWQRSAPAQLLCALALVLPMAAITAWVAATGDSVTLQTMFLGPLVGGGALIFWILLLHQVVCSDTLEALGFRLPRPGLDVILGAGLAAAMLLFHTICGNTVATLFPRRPPAPQIIELISGVVRDPRLLALWLGPVVWIGIALFEELARAFLLRRLWLAWPLPAARWVAILIISALIGFGHLYQGPAAMLSIGLKSVVFGAFYLRTGRIRALIVAHALYDSAQIVQAAYMLR